MYTEKINPSEVTPLDLQVEIAHYNDNPRNEGYPVRCLRVHFADSAESGYVVFFPRFNRAGIAHGADAVWTDATGEHDALGRYINDELIG